MHNVILVNFSLGSQTVLMTTSTDRQLIPHSGRVLRRGSSQLRAVSDSRTATFKRSAMLGEFNIEFPVLPLIESQGPTWFQGVSQFDLERKQMTHIGLFGAGLAAAYVAGTERRVFKEKI